MASLWRSENQLLGVDSLHDVGPRNRIQMVNQLIGPLLESLKVVVKNSSRMEKFLICLMLLILASFFPLTKYLS